MIEQSRLFKMFFPLLRFEFGVLGISIGGKSGSSSFTEDTTQDIAKKETTAKTGTTALTTTGLTTTGKESTDASQQTSSALSTQLSEISSLDEETQQLLQGLLSGLGEGSGDLLSALQSRALTADEDLAGITDPIIADARRKGEERVGQTVQSLSRQAGSSQNSIVQQLGLAEGVKVDQEVASLAATLGLQERQIATEELTGAIGQEEDLAVQLANVLKGASQTQTGTTEQTQQTDTLQQLSELITASQTQTQVGKTTEISELDSLINAITEASGSGKAREAGGGISFSI